MAKALPRNPTSAADEDQIPGVQHPKLRRSSSVTVADRPHGVGAFLERDLPCLVEGELVGVRDRGFRIRGPDHAPALVVHHHEEEQCDVVWRGDESEGEIRAVRDQKQSVVVDPVHLGAVEPRLDSAEGLDAAETRGGENQNPQTCRHQKSKNFPSNSHRKRMRKKTKRLFTTEKTNKALFTGFRREFEV